MVADLEAADQEVVDGVEVATTGVVTMMEAMIMVVEEMGVAEEVMEVAAEEEAEVVAEAMEAAAAEEVVETKRIFT